jgi:hypothetical protein
MSPAVRQAAISCITAVIAAVVAGSAGSPVGRSAGVEAVSFELASTSVRISEVERGATAHVMDLRDAVGVAWIAVVIWGIPPHESSASPMTHRSKL